MKYLEEASLVITLEDVSITGTEDLTLNSFCKAVLSAPALLPIIAITSFNNDCSSSGN
jgi:hypothetical protein